MCNKFIKCTQTESTLSKQILNLKTEQIQGYIKSIEQKESEIAEIYEANGVDPENHDRAAAFTATFNFIDETLVTLGSLGDHLEKLKVSEIPEGDSGASSKALADAILDSGNQFAKLKLDCPVFLGNHKDKFEFVNWLAQYNTVISTNKHLKNCYKLKFLQTKAQGHAELYISHLELTDDNYQVAIVLLKKHFLDIPYIRDELIKKFKL